MGAFCIHAAYIHSAGATLANKYRHRHDAHVCRTSRCCAWFSYNAVGLVGCFPRTDVCHVQKAVPVGERVLRRDSALPDKSRGSGTPWRATPALCSKSPNGIMTRCARTGWPERDWMIRNAQTGGMCSQGIPVPLVRYFTKGNRLTTQRRIHSPYGANAS